MQKLHTSKPKQPIQCLQSITILVKPASGLCNMRCKYCFYHDIENLRDVENKSIMTESAADVLIQKAVEAVSPDGYLHFLFQGGEPTLAGLDFFRNFISLEKKYNNKKLQISHSIQTNGVLINEEWISFLKEHHFLVGISLDGCSHIHDSYRMDHNGKGTWDIVSHSLKLLSQNNIETNLLCVVTDKIASHVREVYETLKSFGDHPIQFIPCLDPYESERGHTEYSLTPAAYGAFLTEVFDLWYRDFISGLYISIRLFDDYLRILMKQSPSSCANAGSCGHYLVAESNGDLYPCDFYVMDQYFIGNIRELSITEALASSVSENFIKESLTRPRPCYRCEYFSLCRGGCKRDWTLEQENYYCSSFLSFFKHALPRLLQIAYRL